MSDDYRKLYYNNLYIPNLTAEIMGQIKRQIEEQHLKETQEGAEFKKIERNIAALLGVTPYDIDT